MIVALHVATGAAAGAASRSRLAALLLGPILHLAGDRLPHQDFRSHRLEIGSGVAGVLLLAARRGPLDSATIGAVASSAPDLDHVFPVLRPGGTKLFQTASAGTVRGASPRTCSSCWRPGSSAHSSLHGVRRLVRQGEERSALDPGPGLRCTSTASAGSERRRRGLSDRMI